MTQQTALVRGTAIFAEMQEFARFSIDAQRYIRASIEVADGVARGMKALGEGGMIHQQAQMYGSIEPMRAQLAGRRSMSDSAFLALLIELTRYDLDVGELDGFVPYRFLYERLLGARIRPWLPGAFGAVALTVKLKVAHRISLLTSLEHAIASRWSDREPSFYPERIDS